MSSARGPRVDFMSLSGVGTPMKPKYSLELSHIAIFLSREDWIHGPVLLWTSKGSFGVWFTEWSGTLGV
jgi:hypothetical protein